MFSTAVIVYLFLGGAGAGACAVLAILGLSLSKSSLATAAERPVRVPLRASSEIRASIRWELSVPGAASRLFVPGYVAAAAALMLGVVLLAIDLGRVDRINSLLMTPRLSWIVVGAYALMAELACSAALGLTFASAVRRRPLWVLRSLQWASLAIGFLVMVYTGMLLASMPSVPLWNAWPMPVLFVASASSCGVAVVVFAMHASGAEGLFPRVMRQLLTWDAALIVLEAGALAALFFAVPRTWTPDTQTGLAAAASIEALLKGSLAPLFWAGYVALGMAVPFALDVAASVRRPRTKALRTSLELASAACVLAGGFLMRWCVVTAGMQPSLAMI